MIKVACISCQHPYELDERRLPATGLKMRCPKCGTTFLVFPDARVEAVPQKNTMLGGMAAPPKPVAPPAPPAKVAPPPARIGDDLDLPAPRGAVPKPPAHVPDELDLPAPRGAKPLVPTPASSALDELDLPAPRGAAPKPAKPAVDLELDLPAPRGAVPKPAVPTPAAKPMDDLDLDLPAPRGVAPKPAAKPSTDLDLDLPAPRAARPMPPAAKPAAPRVPLAPPFAPAAPPVAAAPKAALDADDLGLDLPAPRGAVAKPPVAKPAAPAKPVAPTPASMDLEMDLPAPRGAKPATPAARTPVLDELDLPAPRGAASSGLELDLPAPRGGVRKDSVDLPAPKGAPIRPQSVKPALADESRNPFDDLESGGGLELDLPAPSAAKGGKALDLELDLPAPRGKGNIDLPAPKRPQTSPGLLADADQAFGDLDLPVPKRAGMEIADLPTARDGVDLPAPRGIDLPAPRGAADLPAPRGAADLPAPRAHADLPAARGASDLPTTRGPADLPTPRRGPSVDLPPLNGGGSDFADLDLPPPRKSARPPARGPIDGDLDLPPPRPRAGAPSIDDDLELPPPRAAKGGAKSSISEFELPVPEARGHGSRGHGEIDLPEAGRDDMEFADIPQERPTTSPAPLTHADRVSKAPAKPEKKPSTPAGRSRAIPITLGLILVIAGAGAALTLTPYGPFGIHFIERFLPGAGDDAVVATTIEHADELALHDTPTDYRAALLELGRVRHDAGLNIPILARSLLHESIYQLRFGSDAAGTGRAAAIRSRIDERATEDPAVALGLAADELRQGNRSAASSLIARARAYAPDDPFIDILEGTIALAEERPADARPAFEAAADHGGGAAARWGVARAESANSDPTAYDAAIASVLELSPGHVDALLARARRLHALGDDTQATTIASQVVGAEPQGETTLVAYERLRSDAWTFLGEIAEARGRTQRALEAYEEATRADSTNLVAILGEGRMLLGDRPTEALGRFEAVLGAESSHTQLLEDGRSAEVAARLGAARAMIDLDRVQEAHASLDTLATEHPDDADIQLWLGRVEEELEHPEPAEQHYRESIRLAPQVFEGYLALARLYDQAERSSDAVAVLEQARETVPETAQVRQEIGAYALSRSRLPEAETEFRRALALDPTLPSARFGLGVMLRRAGRIEEAAAAFEELAQVDPGHPGLALERGQLFEARGEADRAVAFYRQALTERPDDANLLLRLGAALVAAEEYDEAEQRLAEVQRQQPASAEAEHFVGRIAFARSHYPEAQQHFERAIALDATRGEFFMWAGRAALEANALGTALSRADDALEHDPSLGDAYYVRGVAELRTAAVRDAERDLTRAIELNPHRTEALAALGRCYDEMRRLPDAISAYERAVAANDSNGEWWYHLGRLLLDANRTADSVHALSRATLLGEAATPRPPWLADAHRVQGDGLRLTGGRAGAIEHYQRYLEIAPASAIDRSDVRNILMDMGVVPGD